jgi:hypothetical protein
MNIFELQVIIVIIIIVVVVVVRTIKSLKRAKIEALYLLPYFLTLHLAYVDWYFFKFA